ncbi:hypothetical protein B0T10DRAFT_458683 [Thelonectria olida]|uniref:Uncharacterized protein n=1 Tax=Thelonectria olida TaxID=1576542 RepID=A0A9P8W7G9_9HYPO|nr:hypothetical protein B0T10DRAFT_458683 [Thelonectria olida]
MAQLGRLYLLVLQSMAERSQVGEAGKSDQALIAPISKRIEGMKSTIGVDSQLEAHPKPMGPLLAPMASRFSDPYRASSSQKEAKRESRYRPLASKTVATSTLGMALQILVLVAIEDNCHTQRALTASKAFVESG